ncbi:MAG TPA: hypothetical protein VN857_17285 [Chthoniobacterales bacterium]|jgi:hypothetical protein|nr:hypothetical protein [Chthoniobacterales bacterium]
MSSVSTMMDFLILSARRSWPHTPRGNHFKEEIIKAFNEGFKHKPETTFGTVNDDVLVLHNLSFKRMNFCSIILNSAWKE